MAVAVASLLLVQYDLVSRFALRHVVTSALLTRSKLSHFLNDYLALMSVVWMKLLAAITL